ncbi:MAG: hypothetical protein ACI9RU_001625 [Litorivivens sp.]|jgi:hypothetical protein
MTKTIKFTLLSALFSMLSIQGFSQAFDGYALYNAAGQSTAYLIDSEGDIAHSWSCPTSANYAMALAPSGNIVRGAQYSGGQIEGAAIGGMVQELDPNGDVVWEFIYSSSTYISHHDICLMPNGHVLLIAWEYVANSDLEEMGYEGNDNKYASHIIEVAQDGTGGEIAWEWHVVDHLIQDGDSELLNFGVVSEHPELLNINIPTSSGGGSGGSDASDWFHCNGIDYNETLDQIVFSSRFLSEIFIIDHSTTIEEAASHTGGNSGMGGDFIYRWGNPDNYDTAGDQVLTNACHDARWIIDDGRPNGGFIQIFNNSGNNGASAIDAIDAPANGSNYDLTAGQAYEPTSYSWRHNCIASASGQSSSDRMSNGNVFVNLAGGMGGAGYMYEVDEDDNIVFQYSAGTNKAFRYECDHPGIQALLENPCETADNVEENSQLVFTIFPNPSTGVFQMIGEFSQAGPDQILIHDTFGRLVASFRNVQEMDLSAKANGVYYVTVSFEGKQNTRMISIAK